MVRIDHHVHTSRHSPDSSLDPDELVSQASRLGLDAVVITEHDYQWEPGELAELNAKSSGPLFLSGAEVSTLQGHFLVYGLPDLSAAPPGIDVGDLIRVVRSHDAAIVAAHPFRWDQDFRKLVETHGPAFDALEVYSSNVSPITRWKSITVLANYPMGTTGSSDAHSADILGLYYTVFPQPIRTMSDFVRALRERTGRPGGFEG